ncbi:MAG: thiamine ABC transporter substrate-binding protein [Ornithinimicrobium sp.]
MTTGTRTARQSSRLPSSRLRSSRLGRLPALSAAVLGALSLTGCTLLGGDDEAASTADSSEEGDSTNGPTSNASGEEVVLITHDSFSLPPGLIEDFTAETGYTLTVLPSGDAGSMTNTLALTTNSPLGDAVFGIDTTFASRAVTEGVLAQYTPSEVPEGVSEHELAGELASYLTPVDFGDVCVNVDLEWFAARDIPAPQTLQDLRDPQYRGLFVTPGASTSSPGLAFLLATIAEFGEDGWQDYWRDLRANDVKITAGWEDAYLVDFSAGRDQGERPIVLSYASSPPFTIDEDSGESTTAALMDTCYHQVEYAGVIEGAANEAGGQAAVDYLLSDAVQASLPESMFVFPVSDQVELPQDWAQWAKVAQEPYELPAEQVDERRMEWVNEWADITTG